MATAQHCNWLYLNILHFVVWLLLRWPFFLLLATVPSAGLSSCCWLQCHHLFWKFGKSQSYNSWDTAIFLLGDPSPTCSRSDDKTHYCRPWYHHCGQNMVKIRLRIAVKQNCEMLPVLYFDLWCHPIIFYLILHYFLFNTPLFSQTHNERLKKIVGMMPEIRKRWKESKILGEEDKNWIVPCTVEWKPLWNLATISSRLRDPLAQPFKNTGGKENNWSIARQKQMVGIWYSKPAIMHPKR